MATADELFRTANYNEPHIIINGDRSITIPNELKYLGVQYDHNIETVVFDCPRYWDEHDLNELDIYINYVDASGVLGAHKCNDVTVNSENENIINFSWTILQNLTILPGKIMFLICAQKPKEDETVEVCWHSRLCSDCEILPGLECAHGSDEGDIIVPDNYSVSDLIFTYETEEAITYALTTYLKTSNGPVIYPITRTDAVFNNQGESLDAVLVDINNDINTAQNTANKGVADASNAQTAADNANTAANNAQTSADNAWTLANNAKNVADLAMPKAVYVMSEGTNLDDYVTDGFYGFVTYAARPLNTPAGYNGWLMVLSSGASYKQVWFRNDAVNDNDHEIYVRSRVGDYAWGGWVQLMTMRGGNFNNIVKASETPVKERRIFNEETRVASTEGELQSVKYFINVIDEVE